MALSFASSIIFGPSVPLTPPQVGDLNSPRLPEPALGATFEAQTQLHQVARDSQVLRGAVAAVAAVKTMEVFINTINKAGVAGEVFGLLNNRYFLGAATVSFMTAVGYFAYEAKLHHQHAGRYDAARRALAMHQMRPRPGPATLEGDG